MTSPRVLVTRAAEQADATIDALRDVGLDPVLVPAIEISQVPGGRELDDAARVLHTYRWVVVTSANGARAVLAAAERVEAHLDTPSWAAIGGSTARILEREGIEVAFTPITPDTATLAAELEVGADARVLVVRGDLAGDALATALRRRGAVVDDIVGYIATESPSTSLPLLRNALADGDIAAVIFTSGSTVRGLVGLAAEANVEVPDALAICIGPSTAAAARAAGFTVGAVAPAPEPSAIALATSAALDRVPVTAR